MLAKMLLMSCLLAIAAACQGTGGIELPEPYESNGLNVEVEGLYKQGFTVVGISGIAENVSGKDITSCFLSFDVVDADGIKVGDAFASTQGLRAGQKWRFQALFTIPFRTAFKAIRPGRATVM